MKDNFFNINSFLSRFKNLRNPSEDKTNILLVINTELNTSLTEKEIAISKGVIRINTSSLIKNLIFLKKPNLINLIQEKFPELQIVDIL